MFLFLWLTILKIFSITIAQKYQCNDLSNITSLREGYCDNHLISTLYQQLQNVKTTNKYLKLKHDYYERSAYRNCPPSGMTRKKPMNFCAIPQVYRSCSVAIKHGESDYLMASPIQGLKPFRVYCLNDTDGKGAWTVIQRRINGFTSFSQKWTDYVKGFGNLHGNFWLGLEKIHALTSNQPYELRIELQDFGGNSRFAKYQHFALGDNFSHYALRILGPFSGNAGNSLYFHQGLEFSTPDQLNEEGNACAKNKTSGWWFAGNCGRSNLNGIYQTKQTQDSKKGIFWDGFKRTKYSLNFTQMAIRARDYCH